MGLSAVAFIEKNKLASNMAWVILLKIKTVTGTIIRVCRNTEDVTWPVTDGNIYTAFPLELGDAGESSEDEVPSMTIRVGNASRAIQAYLEAEDGMVDAEVTIRVVHSTHITTDTLGVGINNNNPEIELNFIVMRTSFDDEFATFTLGAIHPYKMRFPRSTLNYNFCRYKDFKGDRCQYAGGTSSCDRSLATCKILNNSEHFGGSPGTAKGGLYV